MQSDSPQYAVATLKAYRDPLGITALILSAFALAVSIAFMGLSFKAYSKADDAERAIERLRYDRHGHLGAIGELEQ